MKIMNLLELFLILIGVYVRHSEGKIPSGNLQLLRKYCIAIL